MLLGRYRLGRELGRGAYGVVNVAGDFRDGRRSVAIKSLDLSVLPRSETAWTADAIEQEVALMRRLDHPNVVRVFDLVRASGSDRLFIIMELCRGNLTIAARIAARIAQRNHICETLPPRSSLSCPTLTRPRPAARARQAGRD